MPPKVVSKRPRKPVHLTVGQKLELLEKLESGKTVAQMCQEYGVKKQTVSDFKKQKAKLQAYAVKFGGVKGDIGRKHMRQCKLADIDAAVYKWYVQQRSCGVAVRGIELAESGTKLAAHLGHENLKGSDGWLWRFRRRHNIRNLKVTGG